MGVRAAAGGLVGGGASLRGEKSYLLTFLLARAHVETESRHGSFCKSGCVWAAKIRSAMNARRCVRRSVPSPSPCLLVLALLVLNPPPPWID